MNINTICHSRCARCRYSVIVSDTKYKVEVAPLHTMKVYRGLEVCIQSFITLVIDGCEWTASALYPGKAALVPNQYEAVWAPDLV
jgi:hypothetical protein